MDGPGGGRVAALERECVDPLDHGRAARLLPAIADDLLTGAAPGLLMSLLHDKDVVRNGIPGVMNADEEQQQRRRRNAKQGVAHMGASSSTSPGRARHSINLVAAFTMLVSTGVT